MLVQLDAGTHQAGDTVWRDTSGRGKDAPLNGITYDADEQAFYFPGDRFVTVDEDIRWAASKKKKNKKKKKKK